MSNAGVRYQNIIRLEITMYNVLRVKIGHRNGNLPHNDTGIQVRKISALGRNK
jgi:hypothetical protein